MSDEGTDAETLSEPLLRTLADLTARVDRLEQQAARTDRSADSADLAGSAEEGGQFWLVERLRAQSPDTVVYGGLVTAPGLGPVEWQMAHAATALLGAQWSDTASRLAALGHPVRLQILQQIASGEAGTAAELADTTVFGSTGQIYHHLRQLLATGWIRASAKGRYQVPTERMVPLLVVLGACAP